MDLKKMMKQAQEIQGRMQQMQEDLAAWRSRANRAAGSSRSPSTASWRRGA
jgi:DNA-binding protein YbaB